MARPNLPAFNDPGATSANPTGGWVGVFRAAIWDISDRVDAAIASVNGLLSFTSSQSLTAQQKTQALANIGALGLTGAQSAAGVKTFTDGIAVPDGNLSQASIAGLTARLATIEATLAGKADVANAIAQYVPAGGSPDPNLPINSIAAFEVVGGSTGAPDPTQIGFAYSSPASATNFTINLPSGAQSNDMLVIVNMHNPGFKSDGTTVNDPYTWAPSGSSSLATATLGTTNRMEVTYKPLVDADITAGNVKITFAGPQKPTAGAWVVRNGGTPVGQVTAISGATTTATPPPLNLPRRSVVITVVGRRATGVTLSGSTVPSGESILGSDVNTGSSTGGETAMVAAQYPTVQPSGTLTPAAWTVPSSSNFFVATIAVPTVS